MKNGGIAILGLLVVLCFAAPLYAAAPSFDDWLEQFKAKAIASGISEDVANQALSGLSEDEQVVKLDRKQPESKITLSKYLKNTVTERRIRIGREMKEKHRDALEAAAKQYNVPVNYILALWGIETDYGNYTGGFSIVNSLATLAYEGRRREFFSDELMASLKILGQESMASSDLTGSWAGAMGNCQFMPSTYLRYAVDADGDGKRDIWNSMPDTFASIANYIHSLGWNPAIGWGGKATSPKKFHPAPSSIKRGKSAKDWHKRGVSLLEPDAALSKPGVTLYAIYPGSTEQGVFLVTENYKTLLQWNRSRYFATAVGMLADAIGE